MSVYLKSYSSNKQLQLQTRHFDVTGSVKWKNTVPFGTGKFRKLKPKFLVEWIALNGFPGAFPGSFPGVFRTFEKLAPGLQPSLVDPESSAPSIRSLHLAQLNVKNK